MARPASTESVPPSDSLGVAVIGGGPMALHHARTIAQMPRRARVVAFADPNAAARDAMAAVHPGVPGFASLREILDAMRPDVVHVCTPFPTHEEIASEALEAGCHIYVEKPFTEGVAAADRLLSLAESMRLKVCAGHQLLFQLPARRAAELAPRLGGVVHVESYFSFRAAKRAGPGRAPRRADEQLLDILPHPVYVLLRFIAAAAGGAEPVSMSALDIGPGGTVHASFRRGATTGTLVVTLDGRPIESYLRMVGKNGSLHADFVRGTVQRLIGPGSSGIDKLLAPYQIAGQLLAGTTTAMTRRFVKGQRSYPGLAEIFSAFYDAILSGGASPVSPSAIRETVAACEKISSALAGAYPVPAPVPQAPGRPFVLVTGGTGFLGRELVNRLVAQGRGVRVAGRREPAPWDRVPGVDYVSCDLSRPVPVSLFSGVDRVIHCAAETAGGWEEHQRNSIEPVRALLLGSAHCGVSRFVHVSSLAVAGPPDGGGPIDEDAPLDAESRGRGPYVWGKTESERLAVELGASLGAEVRIVRPGALVDFGELDPPGALGRRVGNLFVAVGWPGQRLWVVDVRFAARVLCWILDHFDETPKTLHLLEPVLPTRREVLRRLKDDNPDLRVVWLPPPVLWPLSWAAVVAQKLVRPGKPATHLARVFASKRYDTSRIAALAKRIETEASPLSAGVSGSR